MLAVAADDERLRHAVDAPIDRGAAVRIDADRGERIAVAVEKTPRVLGLVLVVDADQLDAAVLRELRQERDFVVTRHAPRRPDIHQRHLAGQRRRW